MVTVLESTQSACGTFARSGGFYWRWYQRLKAALRHSARERMFVFLTVLVIVIVLLLSPFVPLSSVPAVVTAGCKSAPPITAHCRYELLTPNAIPKGFMDGKQACEKMVSVRGHLGVREYPRYRSEGLGPPLSLPLVLTTHCPSPHRFRPWNWTPTSTGWDRARSSSGRGSWPSWRRSGTSRSRTSSCPSRQLPGDTWLAGGALHCLLGSHWLELGWGGVGQMAPEVRALEMVEWPRDRGRAGATRCPVLFQCSLRPLWAGAVLGDAQDTEES